MLTTTCPTLRNCDRGEQHVPLSRLSVSAFGGNYTLPDISPQLLLEWAEEHDERLAERISVKLMEIEIKKIIIRNAQNDIKGEMRNFGRIFHLHEQYD